MPGDPQNLTDDALELAIREAISQVLLVPLEEVRPESNLLSELGAESIDFLDLIFRLEHRLGNAVNLRRWEKFIAHNLPGKEPGTSITTRFVIEFAASALAEGAREK